LLSYEAIPLSADKVLSGIELALSRSWPRGARYFCLDTKVPKKSSQQIGFFAHKTFALQSGQNHGLQLFCPATLALSQCFCKNLLCPFLRSRPPLFCPLSPEAYLLTEECFLCCCKIKKAPATNNLPQILLFPNFI
jgi:hypothetical protein